MDTISILYFLGSNAVIILLALLIIISLFLGIRIVPQSQKYVVERFGRLHSVLGPGINFVVPFLDVVRHKISILERQLPTASQDAITKDNVLVQVDTAMGLSLKQNLTIRSALPHMTGLFMWPTTKTTV